MTLIETMMSCQEMCTVSKMARAGLMTRFREALVADGLAPMFSFHDLRHTFGTTMARQGVPVGTIQAWMGHADLTTTQLAGFTSTQIQSFDNAQVEAYVLASSA